MQDNHAWKVVEPRPEPTSVSRSNAGNKVVLGYDLLEFKKSVPQGAQVRSDPSDPRTRVPARAGVRIVSRLFSACTGCAGWRGAGARLGGHKGGEKGMDGVDERNDLISSLTHSISFRSNHHLLTPFLCLLGQASALCRLAHLVCAYFSTLHRVVVSVS